MAAESIGWNYQEFKLFHSIHSHHAITSSLPLDSITQLSKQYSERYAGSMTVRITEFILYGGIA